ACQPSARSLRHGTGKLRHPPGPRQAGQAAAGGPFARSGCAAWRGWGGGAGGGPGGVAGGFGGGHPGGGFGAGGGGGGRGGPVEDGQVRLRPVLAVVVLEVGGAAAPFDRAGRVEPFERALLLGVGAPAQVGHAHDLLAVGGDGGEERIGGVDQVADDRGRDRP